MKPVIQRIALPLLAVALLLLVVAYMAGLFSDRLAPQLLPPTPTPTGDRIAVEVSQRDRQEALPASVQAKQASMVSSRLLATIKAVHVRAGDSVTRGQLLVELDPRDLQSRLAQTREQVRVVDARLAEARANRDRIEGLFERKLVAKAELDRARTAFDSLSAERASLMQRVQEAETALSHTRITSPIDGRIVDRLAEPGDTAAPGGALLSIYNPGTLRIEARVREALALGLTPEQPLQVTIPSLQLGLTAHLEELVPSADPGSRSFLVKARIEQHQRLMPGMYAELQVPAGEEQLLLIPRSRVAQVGQLDLVWVASEAGPERRFVRLGRVLGEQVVVLAGLTVGDQLLPVPQP